MLFSPVADCRRLSLTSAGENSCPSVVEMRFIYKSYESGGWGGGGAEYEPRNMWHLVLVESSQAVLTGQRSAAVRGPIKGHSRMQTRGALRTDRATQLPLAGGVPSQTTEATGVGHFRITVSQVCWNSYRGETKWKFANMSPRQRNV